MHRLHYGLFALSVVASSAIALVSCDTAKDTVTIGAVLPLTGDAATFGNNALRGAQLAVLQTQAEGASQPPSFIIISEDSRGNPAEAASAARKLIDVDGAQLLIGDVTSAGTHSLIPIITAAQTPTVSPAASDPALSGASSFFARVWPSDIYEARIISDYANDRGFSELGIVFANTDYGVAMADEFQENTGTANVQTAISVDRETLNYRPTIERLRLAAPDALFLILYPEDTKRFLQQLHEAGFSPPLLATATFEDPSLIGLPGSDKVVFASPLPPASSSARKEFEAAYRKQFGTEPGVLSDTGYDAAEILIKSYQVKGAEGPAAVMDYIYQLENYDGVSGRMTFNNNGDVMKEYGLKTVRNGEFAWLNQ